MDLFLPAAERGTRDLQNALPEIHILQKSQYAKTINRSAAMKPVIVD